VFGKARAFRIEKADVAQPVEQRFRKPWVTSSSLVIGSSNEKTIGF
jgi:hypothetical protein